MNKRKIIFLLSGICLLSGIFLYTHYLAVSNRNYKVIAKSNFNVSEVNGKEITDKVNKSNDNDKNYLSSLFSNYKSGDVVGKISIPSLLINNKGLDYNIIYDATEDNLKKSVCQLEGSRDIDEKGNVVLGAHANADGLLFGKLKLINLGDKVYLASKATGKIYEYEVSSKKVVAPDNVSDAQPTDYRKLVLFTCENLGKDRLVVVCDFVK